MHLLSFYIISFFILAVNYQLVGFKLSYYICNVENRNIFCRTLDIRVPLTPRSLIAGGLIRKGFCNSDKILKLGVGGGLLIIWEGVCWFFYFRKLGAGSKKIEILSKKIGCWPPPPSRPTIRNGRVLVSYVKSELFYVVNFSHNKFWVIFLLNLEVL